MTNEDILVRPIVTEKSSKLMALGKYTFRVPLSATKPQIRRAVESLFKVGVVNVHTEHVHGKVRRQGRTQGQIPDWKKAIVTIEPGKTIEFFEGV